MMGKDCRYYRKSSRENNIYYLGKYLDLKLTENRLSRFSKSPTIAQNSQEVLFSNLIGVFKTVYNSREGGFALSKDEVVGLAKRICSDLTDVVFGKVDFLRVKTRGDATGDLLTARSVSSSENLVMLIEKFNVLKQSGEYEILLLIVCFYIDFVNQRIFENHNDEIGLTILHCLLFFEFPCLQYSSFFQYLLGQKEMFGECLKVTAFNYRAGYPLTDNVLNVIVNVLYKVHHDLDKTIRVLEIENNNKKTNTIENTILKMIDSFSKDEIRAKHPNASISTIDRTLKRLKNEGKIMPLTKGRSSKWIVIKKKTTLIPLEQF
jgi:hypothetical protein